MEKYTIVIPTRDRAETLDATLRTCLRQEYENFEIIVCDNYSSDETKFIVDSHKDIRIRYINPGRRLSMSGNFEFALSHVTDGFVMFIGSDDGVMPDAVEYVNSIVCKYQVDAVSCRQATYTWPTFPDKSMAGNFVFGGWRRDVEIRKTKEWINKTLNFQVNYCFDLPNLYCGFVRKRTIDKAIKDGRYFRSITPDAYSAFATAIFIDKYAFSHRSFVIAGSSPKSNGVSSMNPSGSTAEASKFFTENDIAFFEGFINCPSYEVSCAEAFAQVARAFPDRCTSYSINYRSMLNGALSNLNLKTDRQIKEAVSIMAINFDVNVNEKNNPIGRFRGKSLRDVFHAFLNLITPSKVVAISSSAALGIKNIDDAALVAYIFEKYRDNSSVITNKNFIGILLRKLVSF